jgi:WD40 repeat protein/transcriptional regulator with XRE-family HTH domain
MSLTSYALSLYTLRWDTERGIFVKQISSGKPDYAFGQIILTLRTAIRLTQAGLAERLGISRRAVGAWETGLSYPKAEHLKELIVLGMQHQAFPSGREEEEIRALWQASHQKTWLDEHWLTTVLDQQSLPLPLAQPDVMQDAQRGAHSGTPTSMPPVSGPRIDWGDALAVPMFYGREQDLAQVSHWVLEERCRVVSLLGMGGIGKSALAVQLMHRLAPHFDVVIFRSLRDAPPCEELLDNCLQVLAPQLLRGIPLGRESHLRLLLEQLRSRRILLALDNLESLLLEGDALGHLRPDVEGYEQLLRRIAETAHQSCLLLTSREKPAHLRPLEGKQAPVRSLRLGGLDPSACEHLLTEKDVVGSFHEQARLVEAYVGNPLALKIVTETIVDLFGGAIGPFLAQESVIFGSIADLLQEQFARLSSLEQTVLYWLAIVREPITLEEFQAILVAAVPRTQLVEAIDALRRRSLIEPGHQQGSFTLQSVVLEYVSAVLIEEASREIEQQHLTLLLEHGLEQASAHDYVRQTQQRLLLAPLLTCLQSVYQGRGELEEHLLGLLDQLRERAEAAQGYGPANLMALLRLQQGNLRGVDLSHLLIRGASLQGTDMQDASLAGASIHETVFTEALDATWSVSISRSGTFWAAGTWRGEVRVWSEEGQRLHLAWQAHTDNVFTLAVSPDERLLATGGWEGAVKLWDLHSGALLWTGWHTGLIFRVAFAPDGHTLTSGGSDALIQLWDVASGKSVQELESPGGAVYTVAYSPDGHLLASGGFDGCIHLWQLQESRSATLVRTLVGHSNWVHRLAFAPDGTLLASASWDHTVKLWDLSRGEVEQTLSGHSQRVAPVAWSPDGGTIATCGDATIQLWDVAQQRYRATLQGHRADIYDLAFTPESRRLLSGSEDSTLRVWDVSVGQCLRTIEGYAVSFSDLAWSPDGHLLAIAGSDAQVILWQMTGEMGHRELRGHHWMVYAVAWSPDGHLLASGGWDNSIRLWEPGTGKCLQVLCDPDNRSTLFHGIAWSPDGCRLVSGTSMNGMQMWEMGTHTRCWAEKSHQTAFRTVAWNPEGTRIASGGEDGYVYLWDAENGTLLLRLSGHHGMVTSLAWSPDGHWLASAGGRRGSGEVFVWQMYSGERVRDLRGHLGAVWTVTWDQSSDHLISGDSEGIMRWWHIHSGQCLHTQAAHQGTVRSLKISPDGNILASCGMDGTIKLWGLQSRQYVQTLRYERPYERLDITGIRGLTQARKATLRALGAIEKETRSL